MTIVEGARAVTGGIDTHGEVHVAAALDEVGGLLGTESFDATPDGYSALLSWLAGFGAVGKVGVEGTGSYGAGLARFLARAGVEVIEVGTTARTVVARASPMPFPQICCRCWASTWQQMWNPSPSPSRPPARRVDPCDPMCSRRSGPLPEQKLVVLNFGTMTFAIRV